MKTPDSDSFSDTSSIASLALHANITAGATVPDIVPSGYTLSIARDPSDKHILHVVDESGSLLYQVYRHAATSDASHEDLTLHSAATNLAEYTDDIYAWSIGGVNFQHWLRDRSSAVVVRTAAGETELARPQGSVSPYKYAFCLPASSAGLTWERDNDGQTGVLHRRGRRCVDDETGQTVALWTSTHSIRSSRSEMRLEVVTDDLRRDDLETLLLTVVALRMKTRSIQVAVAPGGIAAGLETLVGLVKAS